MCEKECIGPDIVLIQAYLNIYLCFVFCVSFDKQSKQISLTELSDSSSLSCSRISGHVKICSINGKIIPHVLSSRDNEAL